MAAPSSEWAITLSPLSNVRVVQAMSGLTAAVGKVDEQGTPLTPQAFAVTTTAYAIATGV